MLWTGGVSVLLLKLSRVGASLIKASYWTIIVALEFALEFEWPKTHKTAFKNMTNILFQWNNCAPNAI